MRIGVMTGTSRRTSGVDDLVARGRELESRGFASMWTAHIFGVDSLTALALVGRETRRIELGTAVVPSYPRHPVVMAQQALTTQAACGGRFTLGIGLSHRVVIEGMFGLSYERRAKHMREYLSVLGPLLRGEPAKFEGEEFRTNVTLDVPGASDTPVLVAALGDRMLALAGRLAAGTSLWMTGPATIESHIRPRLVAAAEAAGRPEPRIVAGIPIVLTRNVEAVRARLDEMLAVYPQMPSYRAMLEKEGAPSPAAIALVGDEATLDAGLARLREAGVTDLNASLIPVEEGAEERTLAYLESRL